MSIVCAMLCRACYGDPSLWMLHSSCDCADDGTPAHWQACALGHPGRHSVITSLLMTTVGYSIAGLLVLVEGGAHLATGSSAHKGHPG